MPGETQEYIACVTSARSEPWGEPEL